MNYKAYEAYNDKRLFHECNCTELPLQKVVYVFQVKKCCCSAIVPEKILYGDLFFL